MKIEEKEIADLYPRLKREFSREETLNRMDMQLQEQGFSGSTNIPKLIYLSATTRFFDDPVSVVVMGPSGAGKTFSIEAGLQFIPPDAVERFSGMSEKALVYAKDLDLKHKILYLGEASGMAEGSGRVFLRQLLTEKRIDYLTVQKTAKGMQGERLDTIEGPVCFFMATTASFIHHEDQTRLLTVNVSESRQRVREALRNQALGKSPSSNPVHKEPWYELHRLVGASPKGVLIPFASELADQVPIDHFRVQRDFPKVLALVKANTLLNPWSRNRDEEGRLIAQERDYEAVYDLISAPLDHGMEKAVPDNIRAVVEAVGSLTEEARRGHEGVSQTIIAEKVGCDRSSVSRNCHKAVGDGYLENLNPGKGREARLILGDRKLPAGSVLPKPLELFAKRASEQTVAPW